jgi:hypothetical protein
MNNKKRYMRGKTPSYYKGKYKGITVVDFLDDFEVSHYKSAAIEYIVRSGRKEDNSEEQDIRKAINHLKFHLKLIKKRKK